MKRNKIEQKHETEKCVRFDVEKNVLVEYLWGRQEPLQAKPIASSTLVEDDTPNHTQLLSSHFNNNFAPRHLRIQLADLLRVIEEERQHIRNRKFRISSDGSFQFKKEKRRGVMHIIRDIKEIIACLRIYIAKHSSEVTIRKSELFDSTSTALRLFSLSAEMEHMRKLVVAGHREASMSIEEEAETLEKIRSHHGDIIPTDDLQSVEEHLTALHQLFLMHADKYTEESPIEVIQEADAAFEAYLVKSCFISSLEHFIDEYSEYDDVVTEDDLRFYAPASVALDIDVPYTEPLIQVEEVLNEETNVDSIAQDEVSQHPVLIDPVDIIESAVHKVSEILFHQQKQQEIQQRTVEEIKSLAMAIADEVLPNITPASVSVVEPQSLIDESPSSDDHDTSPITLELPISAPQLPAELVTPLAPAAPMLSPRPIQLRGSFIPTKHSPPKPTSEIYRVTTHVSSEKSSLISNNITDASSSHIASQHDENRQTHLNSAHIDTSQLTHACATFTYHKGRKLKAKLPSYMQGILDKDTAPRKAISSFTQARVEDISIDLSNQLLLYSSAAGQNITIPLADILPTQSRFDSMITLRTRDHQYITCIQTSEWRHILTLLERQHRESSPSRATIDSSQTKSQLRSYTAPGSSRKKAYTRQQHRYQPNHTPVRDLALPALSPSEELHKRPFLVSRHVKTADAVATDQVGQADINPLAVQPSAPVYPTPVQRSITSHSKRPTTSAMRPRTEPRSTRPARPGTTRRHRQQKEARPFEDSIDLSLNSSVSIGL